MSLQLEADIPTLRRTLAAHCPDMPQVPAVKRQLLDYQMTALFLVTRDYNRVGARILEIGTGHGASGFVLSRAAPLARIISLTTSMAERTLATRFWQLQRCGNITARVQASWEFLARTSEPWDMVFIDGDHNRIARDLPWFNRLADGGLLLCHDYSPQESRSPSRIVYEELNRMAAALGRPFDLRIVDDGHVGMAGFYRRHGEAVRSEPLESNAEEIPTPSLPICPPLAAGIVMRQEDLLMRKKAADGGWGTIVSGEWALPWSRTLFAASSAIIPWDLVPVGFDLLGKWDLAAPLSSQPILAQALGTPGDRESTRQKVRDLRIPVYAHELLFVRDTEAGRAFLEHWRVECTGGDEHLAFLRALSQVKPRFCVLPRLWLAAQAQRDTINARQRANPTGAGRLVGRPR